MTCPDNCSLTLQSARALLPRASRHIPVSVPSRRMLPPAKPVDVSIFSCATCSKRWQKVEKDGGVRWSDAITDTSFMAGA